MFVEPPAPSNRLVSANLTLHGCQNQPHGYHGIGRFIRDLTHALLDVDPCIVSRLIVDPSLPLKHLYSDFGTIKPFHFHPSKQRTRFNLSSSKEIFHVLSPVELNVPLRRLVPEPVLTGGAPLIATLYDLIPYLFPRAYLWNEDSRYRYLARINLYREADHVIAISDSSKQDAIRILGISSENITSIYPGVSDFFAPPAESRQAVLQTVIAKHPRIRANFILYVGSMDFRRNMIGAIEAYSLLPDDLKASYQFVLVCHANPLDREYLMNAAKKYKVAHRVVVMDYIDDHALKGLYQACSVFFFPSLYEGFGLPVVEAMKCGAPALVGDNSSLREIMQVQRARFDATNAEAAGRKLTEALRDETFRRQLSTYGIVRAQYFTWRRAAEETIACYQKLADEAAR